MGGWSSTYPSKVLGGRSLNIQNEFDYVLFRATSTIFDIAAVVCLLLAYFLSRLVLRTIAATVVAIFVCGAGVVAARYYCSYKLVLGVRMAADLLAFAGFAMIVRLWSLIAARRS